MNRFISNKTHRINLVNSDNTPSEDWVDVKVAFLFEEIVNCNEGSPTKAMVSINLLKTAIINWNLKDEQGNDMPVNEESIRRLEPVTLTSIVKELESVSNLKDFSSTGDEEEDKKKPKGL